MRRSGGTVPAGVALSRKRCARARGGPANPRVVSSGARAETRPRGRARAAGGRKGRCCGPPPPQTRGGRTARGRAGLQWSSTEFVAFCDFNSYQRKKIIIIRQRSRPASIKRPQPKMPAQHASSPCLRAKSKKKEMNRRYTISYNEVVTGASRVFVDCTRVQSLNQ